MGCGLDETQPAVRALRRAGGEGLATCRTGDLRRVVVDDRLRGLALRLARALIPRVPQGEHGVMGVKACDRKPQLGASALARAGGRHDPGRDPLAGQQLATLLELAHSTFGYDRQFVIHGGKDTTEGVESHTAEGVGIARSTIARSGIRGHHSRVGDGCTRCSETAGSRSWRPPHDA